MGENAVAGAVARRLVLLVEDDPSLRKQASHHLVSLGLDVVTVTDGDEALRALRERKVDLVCLDLNLPRTSGYEVCEQIRLDPELADVVVLMTSDGGSVEARAHSYEAGADAYLGKPYRMSQLAKEVERLLEPGQRPQFKLV